MVKSFDGVLGMLAPPFFTAQRVKKSLRFANTATLNTLDFALCQKLIISLNSAFWAEIFMILYFGIFPFFFGHIGTLSAQPQKEVGTFYCGGVAGLFRGFRPRLPNLSGFSPTFVCGAHFPTILVILMIARQRLFLGNFAGRLVPLRIIAFHPSVSLPNLEK